MLVTFGMDSLYRMCLETLYSIRDLKSKGYDKIICWRWKRA